MKVFSAVLANVALFVFGLEVPADGTAAATFKVAFYNIQSGIGAEALAGRPATFVQTINCDRGKGPVNAWGIGLVQKELETKIKNDERVVALGLAEAWNCASPKQVRQVLGWKADSDEHNGTTIVARYGFANVEWLQLDTSRNQNPKDEMWVVHGSVCLTAACERHINVYATHWSGTGPQGRDTSDRQAQQSIAFMDRSSGPRILVGDLNVFEGTATVCRQRPNNRSLQWLRSAGYIDAWAALYGDREGFTGMVNRAGCGVPEGYVWKRIDYAWSRGFEPIHMTRFGMAPPGEGAPSDHYGIIAEYAQP